MKRSPAITGPTLVWESKREGKIFTELCEDCGVPIPGRLTKDARCCLAWARAVTCNVNGIDAGVGDLLLGWSTCVETFTGASLHRDVASGIQTLKRLVTTNAIDWSQVTLNKECFADDALVRVLNDSYQLTHGLGKYRIDSRTLITCAVLKYLGEGNITPSDEIQNLVRSFWNADFEAITTARAIALRNSDSTSPVTEEFLYGTATILKARRRGQKGRIRLFPFG